MVFLIESDPTTTEEDLNGTTPTQVTGLMERHIPLLMVKLHSNSATTRFLPPTVYHLPTGVVNESFGMAQAGTT